MNIGAPSNVCQTQDRSTSAPGQDPCPILEYAGGVWQFKADQKNQSYPQGTRYVTGTRNVVGLDWNNETNTLFLMQHGRDGLTDYHFYPDSLSVELPAEEMLEAKQSGANFGWPYCFYNQIEGKTRSKHFVIAGRLAIFKGLKYYKKSFLSHRCPVP